MRPSYAFALFVTACRPDLPLPSGGEEGGGGATSTLFRLEPDADAHAVPRVLRVHLPHAASIDTADVVFAQGTLTAKNLADWAVGFPSEALLERVVAFTVFREDDEIVVIVHRALDPAERYSVGIGTLGETMEMQVAADASAPLVRVWPHVPSAPTAFFCGDRPLPEIDEEHHLDPGLVVGRFARGTPEGHARSCLRFDAQGPGSTTVVHPPPLVAGFALDPTPIELALVREPRARSCTPEENPIGPGCLAVEDDRVVMHGPDDPVLWVVATTSAGDHVGLTSQGSPFTVVGLEPSASEVLVVEWLSGDGVWRSQKVSVLTAPPRPRLVLNEIYANAIGPEPEQEWIEIVNAGLAVAPLGGIQLQDAGGAVPLPEDAGQLAPGQFAVIVSDGFDEQSLFDVPIASSARLVRVPTLGSNGLSNSGEPLLLRSVDGLVLSAFPSEPNADAGQSIARVEPGAPDEAPDSFWIDETPTPGTANQE